MPRPDHNHPPPAVMALRFRIWAIAAPKGWDMTIAEVAEALGENPRRIAGIVRYAGWLPRFRTVTYRSYDTFGDLVLFSPAEMI
jgi:hypothetical protein